MSHFSLTTSQLAAAAGVLPHVIHAHLKRHGHWKDHTPRKQPNGHHLWPREALRACGLIPQGRATADVRAVGAFMDEHVGYLKDPVLDAAIIALVDPRPRLQSIPELHLHDSFALHDICAAHVKRLRSDDRLTPAQRNDALLGLARAVLPVLDALPPELLRQAQREGVDSLVGEV